MDEIDIHAKLAQIETAPHFSMIFDGDTERAELIADHLIWLHSIRRERPLVSRPFKVGIYIRYFNQTRYENYLDFHKKGFIDTLALCPKWELAECFVHFFLGSYIVVIPTVPEGHIQITFVRRDWLLFKVFSESIAVLADNTISQNLDFLGSECN